MKISLLLQGFSRITTMIGQKEEIIRLAPNVRLEPECRKVTIAYAPVTVRRSYLLPFIKDEVIESWDIQATIRRKDGRVYRVSKLVRTDFNRAIEVAMLEVVKQATLDELQRVRRSVGSRPMHMH